MFGPSSPSEDRNHSIEWTLFLLVSVISLHSAWSVHSPDPFEFLRRGGDQLGYYQWLPTLFVDGNFDQMPWTYGMDDGKWLSLFTLGVSVLQLPFFLLGHFCAQWMAYPVDGYSAPYAVAQMLGAAVYAGAGAVLAFRLAARYSTVISALLAAVCLFAGTNLFFYAVYAPTMSHNYSFFLIGLCSYCALRLLDGPDRPPRAVHTFLFVLSASYLVLVRQLNIIVLLFPLVMALRSEIGLRGFVQRVLQHRLALVLGLVLALVPWVLQSMYWHHILGEFLAYTYGKKEEHFVFQDIVPGMVLMSPKNGWFVYTPLMLPAMVVLLVHVWRDTSPARAIVLVFSILWVLYGAWWCWWLGASYGYRGFVDIYALLAIPLAWLFRSVLSRPWPLRLAMDIALVAMLHLNFGLMERWTWQWSEFDWNWQRYFEQVSAVFVG